VRLRDRGLVTAELAVALPALMLLVAFVLGAVDTVLDDVRCVDAARDAALASARGGDGEAAGLARAPAGATVRVTVVGATVVAVVTVRESPLGPRLGGITVTAPAVASLEPGPAVP
jgi:Flp pilus assembly protein TadG